MQEDFCTEDDKISWEVIGLFHRSASTGRSSKLLPCKAEGGEDGT
jgi:hypothetical protein